MRSSPTVLRLPSLRHLGFHVILLGYVLLAVCPVVLILINAVKTRDGIFSDPLALPAAATFSLDGFVSVWSTADFPAYFLNSLIVTLTSLVLVVLFGAMAAWALSEYRFRGSRVIAVFIAFGIMVPIRLGTVSILQLMVQLQLVNTLTSLILVYTATGIPLAVMILGEFMRQIPAELKDAARCDGVAEPVIFFRIILPLIRPAMATVAVFTMIPTWNDLWFPLILAPGEDTKTVTLGVQQFIGQYVTDWSSVLAALTLAVLPMLLLYALLSRQLIRGLTSGAVK